MEGRQERCTAPTDLALETVRACRYNGTFELVFTCYRQRQLGVRNSECFS